MKTPLGALLCCSILAVAAPARADGADVKRKEAAEKLFHEGREALTRGEHELACARFKGSADLFPVVNTLANVARCEERKGRVLDAVRVWREVIGLLAEGDERLAAARERVAALDARLPKLTLEVDPRLPVEARLSIDGSSIGRVAWAAPIALAPGDHRILVIDAPGRPERGFTVTLAEGERKTLAIGVADSAPPPPPPPPLPRATGRRTAGFVALGVGVAGLVTAGITGGVLLSRDARIHELCPGRICSPEGWDLITGGKPIFIANAVAWGLGIAGAGAGAALLITSRRPEPPRAALAPWFGPGGAGAALAGRF